MKPQETPKRRRKMVTIRAAAGSALAVAVMVSAPYVLQPWYSQWGTSQEERCVALPGDDIVGLPLDGYTLGITIAATPDGIWPWLVQMGQGRGGFYTYTWIENLIGADITNADRIHPEMQDLRVGAKVRLTPDPYLGQPGQFMKVARIDPSRALVFEQVLPNGSFSSWALVLRARSDGTTRLLSRRRAGVPTVFDRLAGPGYVFMDRGVLAGLRERAEAPPPR